MYSINNVYNTLCLDKNRKFKPNGEDHDWTLKNMEEIMKKIKITRVNL